MIYISDFLCAILFFTYSAGVEYEWTERRMVPRYMHHTGLHSSESYGRAGGGHRRCTCVDADDDYMDSLEAHHGYERGGPGWAQYGNAPGRPPKPPFKWDLFTQHNTYPSPSNKRPPKKPTRPIGSEFLGRRRRSITSHLDNYLD